MTDLLAVWHAGRTRRWHMHPHLSATEDYIDGHAARVTLLALSIWPGLSREAIVYALTHDHGEHAVGDVSNPVKRSFPDLAAALDQAEEAARMTLGFSEVAEGRDARVIKIADRLDAWLWMMHHRPHLASLAGWVADLDFCLTEAGTLGVKEPVLRLVKTMLAKQEKG